MTFSLRHAGFCQKTLFLVFNSPPLCLCPSLLPVLQGRLRHHGPVRPAHRQHADVFLRLAARLLRHAVLPCSDQQPVCPAAAAAAPGAAHGPAGPL